MVNSTIVPSLQICLLGPKSYQAFSRNRTLVKQSQNRNNSRLQPTLFSRRQTFYTVWHCDTVMLWQAVRYLKRFYLSHYFLCFWNLKLFDPLDFKPFCIYTVNFSIPESGFIYMYLAITFACWNFFIAFNFFCNKMLQKAKVSAIWVCWK